MTPTNWGTLIRRHTEDSQLLAEDFAVHVLKRNPRTVRRWKSGEQEPPEEVKVFLLDPRPAPWPPSQ